MPKGLDEIYTGTPDEAVTLLNDLNGPAVWCAVPITHDRRRSWRPDRDRPAGQHGPGGIGGHSHISESQRAGTGRRLRELTAMRPALAVMAPATTQVMDGTASATPMIIKVSSTTVPTHPAIPARAARR